MNAATINQAILDLKQGEITVYPCNNLRASNLGHPCERYLYLLIKHWDQQQPHDVGLQQIFDIGTYLERYVIETLIAAGYECVTPAVRSWKIDSPLITGREDVRIKDPADGQFYPVEIKTLSPQEWDKLNDIEDFYASKKHYVRAYPSQLLTYEYKFGKEKGYFALLNKVTGAIKLIEVPFDWDRADAMLKKGERVYAALADPTEKTIPEGCDDVTVCEKCNLRHICTAAHVLPETDLDDGELEELIDRKMALSEAQREYDEVSDSIKKYMESHEKVIAGKYLVTAKIISKKEYVVAARQERRVSIQKL